MTRAVIDPNVLVAAVLSARGAPAECMRAHAAGRFELVVSTRLLAELGSVLRREKFRQYVTVEHADAFVASLRREGLWVDDPETIEPVSPDPGDDYLIALARTARAHVLVSGDPHLTEIELADIRTMTPREFIERLP